MLCKEVRHIGITVDDLQEAEEYWTLMGFSPVEYGRICEPAAQKITGEKTVIDYIKMTHSNDNSVIELIKYEPDINIPFHISLTVKDIKQFGVSDYYIDVDRRKIKYVKWGSLTIEVVEE